MLHTSELELLCECLVGADWIMDSQFEVRRWYSGYCEDFFFFLQVVKKIDGGPQGVVWLVKDNRQNNALRVLKKVIYLGAKVEVSS